MAADSVFRSCAISVFTDGTKTEMGTGSGIFSDNLDISVSFGLPNTCIGFKAQIYTINVVAKNLSYYSQIMNRSFVVTVSRLWNSINPYNNRKFSNSIMKFKSIVLDNTYVKWVIVRHKHLNCNPQFYSYNQGFQHLGEWS